MKPFSRVLVSLDLTPMDTVLLRFMCRFVRINPYVEDLYFIHAEKDLEKHIFKNKDEKISDLPNDELLKVNMKDEVNRCFRKFDNINIHYKIVEGDPLKQLLHWSRIKFIDLIVAGKKVQEEGRGIIVEKLARKSDCSILFVPQKFRPRFKKILIPVDFSKRTDNVFETACMINDNLPNTQFHCLNVVEVPVGYTRIGKTYDEFAEIMLENAENRWKKYFKDHGIEKLDPIPAYVLNEGSSIAKSILSYAYDQQIDMIMMGSRRQTNASAFILGSVGEELVSRDKDILLLLVKDQVEKHTYDFFKALRKI